MNRRKYHKIQTQFEKKMKLKERVIDMTSSVNHISRKNAKDAIEWICHLKDVFDIELSTVQKEISKELYKSNTEDVGKVK